MSLQLLLNICWMEAKSLGKTFSCHSVFLLLKYLTKFIIYLTVTQEELDVLKILELDTLFDKYKIVYILLLLVQISCFFSKIFSSLVPTGHQHSPTFVQNILKPLWLFLPNIQGPLCIKANPEYNKRNILNWSKTFF